MQNSQHDPRSSEPCINDTFIDKTVIILLVILILLIMIIPAEWLTAWSMWWNNIPL